MNASAHPPGAVAYTAAWVVPVAGPPIRDGWVSVHGDRITALGPRDALGDRSGAVSVVHLGEVALLPGLVNAHTHLELSWARGRVARADAMPAWVRALLRTRREAGADDPQAVGTALEDMHASGTVAVADVGNTVTAHAALSKGPLEAVWFHELVGFAGHRSQQLLCEAEARVDALPPSPRVRPRLAAHAPYSVSPSLLREVGRRREEGSARPTSVHVAESAEEMQFLRDGTGAWRALLEDLGAWDPAWQPPAVGPVEYLAALGVLGPGAMAVHGVQLGPADLDALAALDVTLVTCPRSNRWTGAGDPPVADFYASGVRVAVGTDSLASVPDLNLFAEMASLRELAPMVPAARLLESATIQGARALGLEDEFGSLEPGKRAAIVSVALAAAVDDIEGHLVSGVDPSRLGWVPVPADVESRSQGTGR